MCFICSKFDQWRVYLGKNPYRIGGGGSYWLGAAENFMLVHTWSVRVIVDLLPTEEKTESHMTDLEINSSSPIDLACQIMCQMTPTKRGWDP